jgi:uncharacterized protein YggU (UPF0235/DUF167 family)
MSNPRKYKMHDGKMGAAITVGLIAGGDQAGILRIEDNGTVIAQLGPLHDAEPNKKLLEFLAKFFELPIKNLDIVAGLHSSEKLVSIIGLDADEVAEKLSTYLKKRSS